MNETRMMGITPEGVHIRTREDGTESRTIEGYAIVFGRDSAAMGEHKGKPIYEQIERGAITRELLDGSDIKMTMYHDMSRLLARSKQGRGTLAYEVDDHGVRFSFDAPKTANGDEALELVRSGIVDGCSFMFATRYKDPECVECERTAERTTFKVKRVLGLYDFTLTPDPAYPATECALRSAAAAETPDTAEGETPAGEGADANAQAEAVRAQVAEMRAAARRKK